MFKHMHRERGLTFVELMITLLVLAIFATVAAPSFFTLIKNTRLTGQANDLLGAIVYARSEAIRRNAAVQVEAIDEDWSAGWEVTFGNNVLREYPALQGGNTLTCSDSCVAIELRGGGNAAEARTLTLCDGDGGRGRLIQLLITGRASIANGDDQC